jgi:hypothetical protein
MSDIIGLGLVYAYIVVVAAGIALAGCQEYGSLRAWWRSERREGE